MVYVSHPGRAIVAGFRIGRCFNAHSPIRSAPLQEWRMSTQLLFFSLHLFWEYCIRFSCHVGLLCKKIFSAVEGNFFFLLYQSNVFSLRLPWLCIHRDHMIRNTIWNTCYKLNGWNNNNIYQLTQNIHCLFCISWLACIFCMSKVNFLNMIDGKLGL